MLPKSTIFCIAAIVFACFIAEASCNIDEETGCPLNLAHVCEYCAEDQNRLGCYCETSAGDPFVTANVFTPCRSGKSKMTGSQYEILFMTDLQRMLTLALIILAKMVELVSEKV